MLTRYSRYDEYIPKDHGQSRILVHRDLIKEYELTIDPVGVSHAIDKAGLVSGDTTIKLCYHDGLHIPGSSTIYAAPEYVDPSSEEQKHFDLELDVEGRQPYQSIMIQIIRKAVRLGDARNNKLRFMREQTLYRPAVFIGSILFGVLIQDPAAEISTGKFIGDGRRRQLERQIYLDHADDIQLQRKIFIKF